jgi:copper chaperone
MNTNTYEVRGVNCENCVRSITTKVTAVPGVTGVSFDLPTGTMEVDADRLVDSSAVRQAVEQAGFQIS